MVSEAPRLGCALHLLLLESGDPCADRVETGEHAVVKAQSTVGSATGRPCCPCGSLCRCIHHGARQSLYVVVLCAKVGVIIATYREYGVQRGSTL